MKLKKFWVKLFGYKEGDEVRLMFDIHSTKARKLMKKGSIGTVEYTAKRYTDLEGTFETVTVLFSPQIKVPKNKDFSFRVTLHPRWIEPV